MPDTASDLQARGRERLAEGDAAGGLALLAQAVQSFPDDVSVRLEYALTLEATGDFDAAAYQLLQAEKRSKDQPAILRALGTVFYRKGLYDKAVRYLGRALFIDPSDARGHYALGVVHDARRDPGAAIASYRAAIQIDPHFIDARRTLIDALASLGEHAQAIAESDQLLVIHPRDEATAQNREVLQGALEHMIDHRLLGKLEEQLERSALVQEGQLKRKGRTPDGAIRYANRYADLLVRYDSTLERPTIKTLMLILPDPQRAASARDKAFGVTVVGQDGRRAPADYATALSLTFLREALGVPLTQAGVFYQRLLTGARIDFGSATARFATLAPSGAPSGDGVEEQHGLLCEAEKGLLPINKNSHPKGS
ncbi:MAG: hypothetical protein NVSMB1_12740 [Polyangiales bacterium]